MADCIALANLIVQSGVLLVLLLYTLETLKMRKAAQEQAEGVQKPCLTLVSAARDYAEAVLEFDDAVGGMIIGAQEGNVVIENIGNGPAINVRYVFRPVNPPQGQNVAQPNGYLQNLPGHSRFTIPLAREVLRNLEYRVHLTCESMTGQKYESAITVNNFVLTRFNFGRKSA